MLLNAYGDLSNIVFSSTRSLVFAMNMPTDGYVIIFTAHHILCSIVHHHDEHHVDKYVPSNNYAVDLRSYPKVQIYAVG